MPMPKKLFNFVTVKQKKDKLESSSEERFFQARLIFASEATAYPSVAS